VEKRLRYLIYERRIWSASNGWRQETYEGSNPHDKHAHFSFRYGSGPAPGNPEQITTPWGMLAAVRAAEVDDMPTLDEIGDEVDSRLAAFFARGSQSDGTPTSRIGQDALNQGIPNGMRPGAVRTNAYTVHTDIGLGIVKLQATLDAVLRKVSEDDAEAAQILTTIRAEFDELAAQIAATHPAVEG
jgi:hypothetical protein